MKTVPFGMLCVLVLVGTLGTLEARDLKTASGDLFKNISVGSRDATGITVSHDDGVVFIDFKNLSEDQQQEFGFDPSTYVDGWLQKFAARAAQKQQFALAQQQAAARARAEMSAPPRQPSYPTTVEVSVDTPGFTYGGYPVDPGYPLYYSGYPYQVPNTYYGGNTIIYGGGYPNYCPPVIGSGGGRVVVPPSSGGGLRNPGSGNVWAPGASTWRTGR